MKKFQKWMGAEPLPIPDTDGMACSIEPPQKIWDDWQNDSFYSEEVQAVLNERHPSNYQYRENEDRTYPIFMYRQADGFVLGSNVDPVFLDVLRGTKEMEWTCRLIRSLKNYYRQQSEPQTAIDKFIKWRKEKRLWETSRLAPEPPPGMWKEIAKAIFGARDSGGDGRLRKALRIENQRREKISLHWIEALESALPKTRKKRPNK